MEKRWVGALTLVFVVGMLLFAGPLPQGMAQGGAQCTQDYAAAVAAAGELCGSVPDGAFCLAAVAEATSQAGGVAASGAVQSLQGIAQITTAAFDAETSAMGFAVLTPPVVGNGALTAVLFGGASLVNEPAPPLAPTCDAVSIGSVNIRAEPNTDSAILGQLNLNEAAPILARLADGTWWRILWQGEPAWIFAELAPTACDPATMVVFDPVTEAISGGLPAPDFQSAALAVDLRPSSCADVPRGGLLLQAGSGGASWRVNDVLLGFEGTLLLQAAPDDVLLIYVYDGQVIVEAEGVSRAARAGQLLRVPLLGGRLDSIPGPPIDVVPPDAAFAPLGLLPAAVQPPEATLALPVTPALGEALACSLDTQQVEVMPDAGRAELAVQVEGDAVRVSAQSADGVQRLLARLPGETDFFPVADGNAGDVVIDQPGELVIAAEVSGQAPVVFGVTCSLPQAPAPPPVQQCDSVLLAWNDTQGNRVRFEAPEGAQISIVADHAFTAGQQGVASTLLLFAESGEQVGEVAFVTVGERRVAGPLDRVLLTAGEYVIQWDGDPFTQMQVEALCSPPEPDAAATAETE